MTGNEPTTAAVPEPVFDLGAFGTMTAHAERHGADAVVYRVSGPRIHGAITVRPYRALQGRTIGQVRVSYGIENHRAQSLWAERPEINGVALLGTNLVTATDVATLASSDALRPMRGASNVYGVDTAPPGATTKTRAVVAAILADYFARTDLAELHRHACTREALTAITETWLELEMIGKRLQEAQNARRRVLSRLATLQVIASGEPLADNPVDLLNPR